MQLSVGQIIEDTEAEGPGRRFAIWTQGCSLRCPGCCNPHLFSARGGTDYAVEGLAARIASVRGIEGLTLLGGEPFEQPEALDDLCARVQALELSVMVFSGYTLAQLQQRRAPLDHVDILVDGRFEQSLPERHRRWLGSANQQVHFLTERGRADQHRFGLANTVEIRLSRQALSVNGWPTAQSVVRRR